MSPIKLIAGLVFNAVMYALLLFLPSGTLHWWQAWVFLAITIVVTAVAAFNIPSGLLSERSRGGIQKGQPFWDRGIVILLLISYLGQVLVIPLGVFRLKLMPTPGGMG